MFSQVTTLPPSGFYYLGHLQHTVRALYLISVALVTHTVSQMTLCYKDSVKHSILHDCMTYTNYWILLWCSHAFCTAIICIWILRKKSRCTDFLIHISHSLQHFSVVFRDMWLLQSNNVSDPMLAEAFPSTLAIWSMKDICVSVLRCSLSSPLFAEDAPNSLFLIEQPFFMFIMVEIYFSPLTSAFSAGKNWQWHRPSVVT